MTFFAFLPKGCGHEIDGIPRAVHKNCDSLYSPSIRFRFFRLSDCVCYGIPPSQSAEQRFSCSLAKYKTWWGTARESVRIKATAMTGFGRAQKHTATESPLCTMKTKNRRNLLIHKRISCVAGPGGCHGRIQMVVTTWINSSLMFYSFVLCPLLS